jgi:hypothetical protein
MAVVFVDGFEKYGPSGTPDVPSTLAGVIATTASLGNGGNTNEASQGFLLGAWLALTTSNGFASLMQGRGGAGTLAFVLKSTTGLITATRNLPANDSRIILGFAFQSVLIGNCGVRFNDNGTVQCALWVDSGGHINFGHGDVGGTAQYTSTQTIPANSWHYIEIDLTINSTTGAFQIWLDGASITNQSAQNTRGGSTNNYVNQIALVTVTGSGAAAFDDMYCFDTTGAANNAQRGDSTVDLLVATADSAVAFAKTASVIGNYRQATLSNNAPGANKLVLEKVTPAVGVTLNSIGILPVATSATAKFKGVVYADSSGSPGTLLSSGTEAIGCTNGTNLSLALTTPQALTAGTAYWIGYITDTSIAIQQSDNISATGVSANNTYTSGAPGTAPAVTTGQPLWAIWGNCTGAASNYAQVINAPGPVSQGADLAYNSSSTVGQEDLFTMSALPVTPQSIATVVVTVLAQKSDSGARTLSTNLKSGSTDSASAAITIGTSMQFYSVNYDTDPATGAAWTASGVNAMKTGYSVAA